MKRVFVCSIILIFLLTSCVQNKTEQLVITASPLNTACLSSTPIPTQPEAEIVSTSSDIVGAFEFAEYIANFNLEKDGDGWRLVDRTLSIVGDYAMAQWCAFKARYTGLNQKEFSVRVRSKIEHIVLMDGVFAIPYEAFIYFEELKTVQLPESLLIVGEDSFVGCISLEKIVIPDSVLIIDDGAFRNCSALKELVLPNGIKRLPSYMLAGCAALEEIRVPQSVKYIEEDALMCEGAKRIIFEGVYDELEGLDVFNMPYLQQVVFLSGPPQLIHEYEEHIYDHNFMGLTYLNMEGITIYYLRKNKHLWAPNDEAKWLNRPLIAIDSLSDLPPLH